MKTLKGGIETWRGPKEGTWVEFYAGGLDDGPINGGSAGKAVGGFEPKKWCAAKAQNCNGDWAELEFDAPEVVKGVTLQGWGKSCVSKFTVSTSSDGKTFHKVDGGKTFSNPACVKVSPSPQPLRSLSCSLTHRIHQISRNPNPRLSSRKQWNMFGT